MESKFMIMRRKIDGIFKHVFKTIDIWSFTSHII